MIRTQIAAVCLLVGCAASGFMGWKLRDADYQRHLRHDAAEVAQAEKETRRLEAANESLVQQVRENKAQADAKTQVVYRTIIQEVPKYVTQTQFEERVVASGGLPAGFVWNYNQGVANATAPFPSGLDPDAPTGITVSALAGVAAGNAAVCHGYKAEALSWRDWYDHLLEAWPKEGE